jgi:hypothetical protein
MREIFKNTSINFRNFNLKKTLLKIFKLIVEIQK